MNQTDIINMAKEFFVKALPGDQDSHRWIWDSILRGPGVKLNLEIIKEYDCFDKTSFLLGLSMGSMFVMEYMNSLLSNKLPNINSDNILLSDICNKDVIENSERSYHCE